MASKTLNLWDLIYALTIAEGLTFDADTIIDQIVGVFLGTTDAKLIPAQLMNEVADVIRAVGQDPLGTAMNVGMNVGVAAISQKVLRTTLQILGAPRSKKIGGYTLRWA